jgi:thiol-disulfide isomerase/thioredoxin
MLTIRHLMCATLAVLLTVAILPRARAADQGDPAVTLKVGDPAPALKVSVWVKGKPVAKLDKGQVYVVEFWATWCGPCRQTIPHLSELQKQYKDVVFIGMDCWEDDPAGVDKFVKNMGDKMDYRVALDTLPPAPPGKANDDTNAQRGVTATTWMTASGSNGIPTAFIVNKDSKIVWIGHPGTMNAPLKAIVAGTFDLAREALAAGFMTKIQRAVEADDDKSLAGVCDEFIKAMPEKADIVTRLRFAMALRKKDYAAANQQAVMFAVASKDDAEGLNDMAWALIDPQNPIPGADVGLAQKMALRAVELTRRESSPVLDTAARACFLKGDLAKAVELQTLAVARAEDEDSKAPLKEALGKYTAAAKSASR